MRAIKEAFLKLRSTRALEKIKIKEFDENPARRWLKIITANEDKCSVEFKSGVSVDIEG